MAGPQLNFGGTTVVNPYESLINALGKNGALAQNMIAGDEAKRHDQDRLLRQQQLDMQKTEHQMKVDEQARQLAEIDNTKKFYTGLEKPAELATASALFNQNNNPLLQKQIEDMQYKPTDTAEDTIRKTKLQDELGKFGTNMSAMPEFQETRLQQGRRLLGEMGANAPLAGIKKLDEMHAAEVAASAAKSKEASDAIKHGQDNFIKLNIEAMKHGKGTTITADDGTILPIGGNGKVLNPLSFGVKQTEDKIKDYEAGTKALTSRMDALGAGKAEDIKTGQRVMAMDALNKYAGEGYDPADLASIITTKFQADPKFYEVWKDKQSGIVLTPEELKPLEAKRTASAALDNMKLQEAQYAMLQSQAKNSGTAGADILKTFAPYYQDQITKATGEKALLAMTPEQRQAQATMSYLGKMMAPKTEAAGDKITKGNSAEEVDVTNMVPKLRTIVDDTVDTVVDKHGGTHIAGVALATMGVAETGGDLNASGDGGTAKGLYQHRNERLDALKKFGKADKVETIPHNTQTDFAVSELKSRAATKEFADAYKKDNPDTKFVSQWDELNSKKTAGEAAAYLSEYFEVAKGNSKNPNIVEARREEGARRAKMAEAMYANDYDEFGQNKRRIGKVEEEMIKSGPKVNEKQLSSLELAAEGDPYSLDTLNAKAELAALEKNKKSFSAEILAKPARDWSDSEIKKASVLPDIAKDKRDWTLFDIASSIGGNTPTKQDPAKTKALRLLEDMKQDMTTDAGQEEKGLESANLEVLPLGKMAKETGSAALTGAQYVGSKVPILNRVIKAPVLPTPRVVESAVETLKRANDFNKIGIWRELRGRGVDVTDAMVEEILRKGKVLPR